MEKLIICFCVFILAYSIIPTFFGGVFTTLICIGIIKLLNGDY